MSHRIVLVRHARAAPSAASDDLRPLTDEGTRQALHQGRRLARLGSFGPVLCSPASRCVQTAHALLQGMGRDDEPSIEGGLAEGSALRLALGVAEAAPDGAVLVGHQPHLVDMACALTLQASLPFAVAPATALVLTREAASQAWCVAQVLGPP